MPVVSLKPSFVLATLLTAAHGLTIGILIILPILFWVKLILIAIVIGSLIITTRQVLLLSPHSAIAFKLEQDNTLALQHRDTLWGDFEILGNSLVLSFLVILNLKKTNSRSYKSVIIFFDAIDKNSFRKLRTLLKHGRINISG